MKKVAYFSYKGGAGRSSVAYNTIPYLVKKLNASPKRPIVLLDLDLDSAGITFLLKKSGADVSGYSIQQALAASVSTSLYTPQMFELDHHPIFKKCIPVGTCFGLDNDSNASVLFIPAETGTPINKDANSNYDAGGIIKTRFKNLINFCEMYNCAAIVFDTPAGDQLTAMWSMEAANVIATCMRITYQFRTGTLDYLKRNLPRYINKKFIIIPNAVPTEYIEIDGFVVDYSKIKSQILEKFRELDFNDNKIDLKVVGEGCDFFGVNEVKRFKIQEDILFKISEQMLSEEEKKAINAYKLIADCIAED